MADRPRWREIDQAVTALIDYFLSELTHFGAKYSSSNRLLHQRCWQASRS